MVDAFEVGNTKLDSISLQYDWWHFWWRHWKQLWKKFKIGSACAAVWTCILWAVCASLHTLEETKTRVCNCVWVFTFLIGLLSLFFVWPSQKDENKGLWFLTAGEIGLGCKGWVVFVDFVEDLAQGCVWWETCRTGEGWRRKRTWNNARSFSCWRDLRGWMVKDYCAFFLQGLVRDCRGGVQGGGTICKKRTDNVRSSLDWHHSVRGGCWGCTKDCYAFFLQEDSIVRGCRGGGRGRGLLRVGGRDCRGWGEGKRRQTDPLCAQVTIHGVLYQNTAGLAPPPLLTDR